MNRQPSLARNVVSNWLALGTAIVCTLVLTPVIVRSLQTERYGIWSFLNGLVAYSDLLYLGLGSALIRFVAHARADRAHASVNRLAAVVLSIYTTLGVLCFGLLAAASRFVPSMFAETLPAATAHSASYACVLLGLRLLLAFVASAFSGLLCGHERYDIVNGVAILASGLRLITILTFVPAATDPLLVMALVTCGIGAFETLALAGIAIWYVPDLSIRFVRPRVAEVGELYRFGIQSFFVLLAFKLISYTDTTVIGLTLGAASVALYSLPLQLVEYARLGIGGFPGVFLPRLTLLSARDDTSSLRAAYLSATRITCFLGGWLGGIVIGLGAPFLNLWVGPEFGDHAQAVLVFLTIAAFASAISTQATFPFYQALHLVSRPAIVLTGEAAVNLALSIWLAPRLGIAGVALATALPATFVSLILLPRFLCSRLGLPVSTLLGSGIVPGSVMLVATIALERGVALVLPPRSYVGLVGCATASLPLAFGLVRLTFPAADRSMTDVLRRLRRTA